MQTTGRTIDNVIIPDGLRVDDSCATGMFGNSCKATTQQLKDIIAKAKARGVIIGNDQMKQQNLNAKL